MKLPFVILVIFTFKKIIFFTRKMQFCDRQQGYQNHRNVEVGLVIIKEDGQEDVRFISIKRVSFVTIFQS